MTQMGGTDPRSQAGGTFKASGVIGLAAMAIQAVKQRKQRELDRDMGHFVNLSAGKDEATAQAAKADEIIRQTMPKIQANPHDQDARTALVQAGEMRKKAQLALQQNEQNLRDLANSPRGAKLLKSLEKAAGLDDKQMNSPERQSLNKAIQQKLSTDAKTAQLLSMMTQRQQLSPEARAQSQMVQGGVVGKPATGGQLLTSWNKGKDREQKAEGMANKVGLDTEKMVESMRKQSGLVPVRDDKGAIVRNPDHTMKTRNLAPEEMTAEEYARYQDVKAQRDQRLAQAKAAPVRAEAAMMNARRKQRETVEVAQPGFAQLWAKQISDPTTGITLAQVPAKGRGMVLQELARQGLKVAKPLTGKELDRMDLANNAIKNIEEMQSIVRDHPELFGPDGWWSSKLSSAMGGGIPEARRFMAAKSLANLPAIGIHGVRGKWALQDLDNLDGTLYQSPESIGGILDEIHRSASEFRNLAGRPESIRGGASGGGHPPQPGGGKTVEELEKTHNWKEGAHGWGWYRK